MGDILDGNGEFNKRRATSKAAAEERYQDIRRWEHCEDPYGPIGLAIPPKGMMRSLCNPIEARELNIVFEKRKLDFKAAAEALKVSEIRLESELLEFPAYKKYAQQHARERREAEKKQRIDEKIKKEATALVSVVHQSREGIMVRIVKPSFPHSKTIVDYGDFYVVQFRNTEWQEMIRKARANFGEGGDKSTE